MYKVVDQTLLSSALHDYPVQYRIDEFVYPVFGKLFVFDTLAHAQQYVELARLDRMRIFTAECINPVIGIPSPIYEKHFVAFWNYYAQNKTQLMYQTQFITGTYFCDGVKLLREITE